jgi:hypothetical protein
MGKKVFLAATIIAIALALVYAVWVYRKVCC